MVILLVPVLRAIVQETRLALPVPVTVHITVRLVAPVLVSVKLVAVVPGLNVPFHTLATWVQATANGVTAAVFVDAGPEPAALMAFTVNAYATPLVRPDTGHDRPLVVQVRVALPTRGVAVTL